MPQGTNCPQRSKYLKPTVKTLEKCFTAMVVWPNKVDKLKKIQHQQGEN